MLVHQRVYDICIWILRHTHTHARSHLSIYLSVCLSVCLSTYLPICPSIHPSIHPSMHACMHTYIIIIFSRLLDEVRSTKIMCITASCGFAANPFFCAGLGQGDVSPMRILAVDVRCSYHISWLQHGYNMLHTSFLWMCYMVQIL